MSDWDRASYILTMSAVPAGGKSGDFAWLRRDRHQWVISELATTFKKVTARRLGGLQIVKSARPCLSTKVITITFQFWKGEQAADYLLFCPRQQRPSVAQLALFFLRHNRVERGSPVYPRCSLAPLCVCGRLSLPSRLRLQGSVVMK